ncbi:MAG: peptide-binding protein [Thermaerobacterales bacterium]
MIFYLRKKTSGALALLVLTALVLGACGTSGGQEPTAAPADVRTVETEPPAAAEPVEVIPHGELRYGLVGEFIQLNPLFINSSTLFFAVAELFDGLVRYGPDLQIQGALARDWEFTEDAMTWTFYLREQVVWHDGEPLTAHDVRFTLETLVDPSYSGPRASSFRSLDRVEVVDDHTVKLHLTEPFAPLLDALTHEILPEHILGNLDIAEMRDAAWNREPSGTGAFAFKEWASDQELVLEANPNYWGEGPYIERLTLQVYRDNRAALEALEAGEIHVLDNIPADDIDRVSRQLAGTHTFVENPSSGYAYIGLNHAHPFFGDRRVRQALMMGIDRQAIIDDVFAGYGVPVNSHYPPGSAVYHDDIEAYRHDRQRAAALLEEAGFNMGPDGLLLHTDSDAPFSFKVLTGVGNTQMEDLLLAAQEHLLEIGIDMEPAFLEWNVLLGEHLDTGAFDAYALGWTLGSDPDAHIYFHSESAEIGPDGYLRGLNDVGFRHPEVDRLLEQGRRILDADRRLAVYQELHTLLNRELPYVFLYSQSVVGAVHQDVLETVETPKGLAFRNLWQVAP